MDNILEEDGALTNIGMRTRSVSLTAGDQKD